MQAILAPGSVIDDNDNNSTDSDTYKFSTSEDEIVKSEYEQYDDVIIGEI